MCGFPAIDYPIDSLLSISTLPNMEHQTCFSSGQSRGVVNRYGDVSALGSHTHKHIRHPPPPHTHKHTHTHTHTHKHYCFKTFQSRVSFGRWANYFQHKNEHAWIAVKKTLRQRMLNFMGLWHRCSSRTNNINFILWHITITFQSNWCFRFNFTVHCVGKTTKELPSANHVKGNELCLYRLINHCKICVLENVYRFRHTK